MRRTLSSIDHMLFVEVEEAYIFGVDEYEAIGKVMLREFVGEEDNGIKEDSVGLCKREGYAGID